MSLSSGTRFGSYDIVSLLGAGGMGEVYRARDAKLGRDVAIKVLPDLLAHDFERRTRFEREAQVLASLNHPNIAHIYGLEEASGMRGLVMELIEGPTLADRIAQGPIPLDEALSLARQIIDALEAAHEHGVVHRDLKPANIKLRPDGIVKVLDFGLAKALEPPGASDKDPMNSPTMITQGTQVGMILGTASYMAPEQAKGRVVDKRADVWAFGCVLYEMLTGRRAFGGDDLSETLAFVITKEADWTALPAGTPQSIRKLLQRCLERDPRRRLQAIGDARFEIEEAKFVQPAVEKRASSGRPLLIGAIIGAAIAGLAAAAWMRVASNRGSAAAPLRLTVVLPDEAPLGAADERPAIVLSPDGKTIAYSAGGSNPGVYLRRLESFEASKIAGTDGGTGPFFSPDGKWIAFFTNGKLKKVPAPGGVATPICDVSLPRGATWMPDDTILITPNVTGGLMRVPSTGGALQPVTMLDPQRHEKTHRSPVVLPGGKAILFVAGSDEIETYDEARIVVRSLVTGQQADLITGGYAPVYSKGQIFYVRNGAIFAVPFDPETMKLQGAPAQLLQHIATEPNYGTAEFDVASDGTLVYALGGARPQGSSLAWMDRKGNIEHIAAPERDYIGVQVSPDNRRILLNATGANNTLWLYDIARSASVRLTFRHDVSGAIWTPDGLRATYWTGMDIRWIAADGSGAEEVLVPESVLRARRATPESWSPDGQTLAIAAVETGTGNDVLLYSRRDQTLKPFAATRFNESQPQFSPDGRWLAYVSDEAGQNDVYVRAVSEASTRYPVSIGGGTNPLWNRNGRELIYKTRSGLISVPVNAGASFSVGPPTELVKGNFARGSLAPDGQRFALLQPLPAKPLTEISVVR